MSDTLHPFQLDVFDVLRKPNGEEAVIIQGWSSLPDYNASGFTLEADGMPLDFQTKTIARPDVTAAFPEENIKEDCGFSLRVELDAPVNEITLKYNDRKLKSWDQNQIEAAKADDYMRWSVDTARMQGGFLKAAGWLHSTSDGNIALKLTDQQGNPVPNGIMESITRPDVTARYMADDDLVTGFVLQIRDPKEDLYYLQVEQDGKQWKIPVKLEKERHFNLSPSRIKTGLRYLSTNGFSATLKKVFQKVTEPELYTDPSREMVFLPYYDEWFRFHRIHKAELEEQRNTKLEKNPKFSLIVAAFNTPVPFFERMVSSVQEQSYGNWELLIADGSDNNTLEEWLNSHPDPRIKYRKLDKNYGISGNMMAAAEMADGDYICLYDHDDFLEPDALFEMAKAVNQKEYDFIYTDEDKYATAERKYAEPNLKPDFSPDLLRSVNYICHFLAVRKDAFEKVGGLNPEFDGAQDHDLVLKLAENTTEDMIYHIPKVLYHWREHENSTAKNAASKTWAFDAGLRATDAHLARQGLKGHTEATEWPGKNRVRYEIEGNPKVSIIVPSKDHIEDLDKCITSFEEKSKYRNFEFIVVENNSTEPETFQYYDEIQKRYDNVKVVKWEGPFNYSGINNMGVSHADGEILLLLNNDTELITEDLLTEMIGLVQRKDVGAVGAELFFPDDTIQHLGVVIGMGGIGSHIFAGEPDDTRYYWKINTRNVSCVTAACLMVRKEVYDEVGGFNEELQVAFNDVDFCLKIREKGYHIVETPFAKMYHYESKSRGYEDTPEKKARFMQEHRTMLNRWRPVLMKDDPYYNSNFSYITTGCFLAAPNEGERPMVKLEKKLDEMEASHSQKLWVDSGKAR